MKTLKEGLKYLVLLSVIFAYSCAGGGGDQAATNEAGEEVEGMKELLILYPNWAEGIAFTNLAKAALEAHGYEPTIKPIEPGPIYASLAQGDADIFLDAWLPHTHKEYWERYGDDLIKIGESFSNGTTGLVVPSYVTVNSIEELNEHADKFDGEIIGIGSGAGIHRNTERAIEAYGLDFEQVTSSGPAMMASLRKAVNNENWVIITGWKPHYMWADYDLKYLEDPQGIYPKDVCAIVSRTGFEDDYPELTTFFENFNLEEEELYSLMQALEEGDDAEDAAAQWYQENKDMIDGWF